MHSVVDLFAHARRVAALLALTLASACGPSGAPCTNDSACPSDALCVDAVCEPVAACNVDADCMDGARCRSGLCDPRDVSPVDAGDGDGDGDGDECV